MSAVTMRLCKPRRRRYATLHAQNSLLDSPNDTARSNCDMLYGTAQSGCQKSLTHW